MNLPQTNQKGILVNLLFDFGESNLATWIERPCNHLIF